MQDEDRWQGLNKDLLTRIQGDTWSGGRGDLNRRWRRNVLKSVFDGMNLLALFISRQYVDQRLDIVKPAILGYRVATPANPRLLLSLFVEVLEVWNGICHQICELSVIPPF